MTSAAICPYCGQRTPLKWIGTMVAHYSRVFFGGEPEPWCFGSGRKP